jgi:hypothetical protein
VPVVCGSKRGTFHTASLTVSCSCSCSSCTQHGELAAYSTVYLLVLHNAGCVDRS